MGRVGGGGEECGWRVGRERRRGGWVEGGWGEERRVGGRKEGRVT